MTDRDSLELEKNVADALARSGMDGRAYETDWLPEERSIFWQGRDLDEFLRLAALSDANLLYVVKLWTASFDEFRSKYASQVYEIDVAFFANDHFHVCRSATPWSVEYWRAYDERDRVREDRGGREAYC